MKKKGFTLIELLAVIVILAIIALIATPMILNVIDNAKKGAAESSAYGYIDAVEKSILEEELNGTAINKNKIYNVSDLTFVNIKGDKPSAGWVELEKGIVKDYSLKIGDYIVNNEDGKAKAEKGDTVEEKPDGSSSDGGSSEVTYAEYKTGAKDEVSTIYYNPVDAVFCTVDDYNNNTDKLGKTGCLKWYAIENSDSNKATVNIILDHNTTALIAWNETGSNTEMKDVKDALENDTTTWDSSLSPRLIEADEIATITGNTTFNGTTSTASEYFYFETNNNSSPTTYSGDYSWLYDYTYDCTSYGCNIADSSTYGYWTSTPVTGNTDGAWRVDRAGRLLSDYVNDNSHYGVRPVITISKTQVS